MRQLNCHVNWIGPNFDFKIENIFLKVKSDNLEVMNKVWWRTKSTKKVKIWNLPNQ